MCLSSVCVCVCSVCVVWKEMEGESLRWHRKRAQGKEDLP